MNENDIEGEEDGIAKMDGEVKVQHGKKKTTIIAQNALFCSVLQFRLPRSIWKTNWKRATLMLMAIFNGTKETRSKTIGWTISIGSKYN